VNVSEIRLSTAIMTHPARRAHAERIRDEYPELNATIAEDPAPGEPPSSLRSARRAWAAVGPGATHHLVLQDDVVLSSWFAEEIRRATAARPGDALSLFSEWGSQSRCAARVARLASARGTRREPPTWLTQAAPQMATDWASLGMSLTPWQESIRELWRTWRAP
jgi:hypothetical protein